MHTILTNMDKVALAVQHDVAVVPVFNLKQEEQQAISCHTADEVVSRLNREEVDYSSNDWQMTDNLKSTCTRMWDLGLHLLERQRGFITILVPEIVVHAEVRLSAQLVTRLAVRDALDYPTLRWRIENSMIICDCIISENLIRTLPTENKYRRRQGKFYKNVLLVL